MKYIVDEDRLKELLEKENTLKQLKDNGLDDWLGYYVDLNEQEGAIAEQLNNFSVYADA